MSVAVVGLVLGLCSLIVGDRLVPAARAASDALKGRATAVAVDGRGLWLRDGDRFVSVEKVVDPTRLRGVHIYAVSAEGDALNAVDYCEEIEYRDGRWLAQGWSQERPGERELVVFLQDERALELNFGPDVIELFLLRSDSLSLPGLRRYIAYLEQNKLDSHAPRLSFWKKLSAPLSVVAMVLLAVPFVLGPLRDTGAGQRLFIGVLMGIGFYVFSETIVSMGAVYRWSPLLAAFAPGAILSCIASWRLLTYRAR